MPQYTLADRRVVITGASSGIGLIAAQELARDGAELIFACRSEAKTAPLVDALQRQFGESSARFLPLDLASFQSVRRAAQQLLSEDVPIQVLINNAGIAAHRGVTEDGFENTFGVNHLGHFLFTLPLLPLVARAGQGRVITVASRAHRDARTLDLDIVRESTPTYTGLREYAASKLANVLFAAELARRTEGHDITSVSLHPGVVATDVWRRIPRPFSDISKLFMISEERGARTTLHCARDPDIHIYNGKYFNKSKPQTPSKLAQDRALARDLWEHSERWTETRLADILAAKAS